MCLLMLECVGFYVDNLPNRKIADMLITLEGRVVPQQAVKKGEGRMDKMLLVDLEKAWDSMRLPAPGSGDVDVVLRLP